MARPPMTRTIGRLVAGCIGGKTLQAMELLRFLHRREHLHLKMDRALLHMMVDMEILRNLQVAMSMCGLGKGRKSSRGTPCSPWRLMRRTRGPCREARRTSRS